MACLSRVLALVSGKLGEFLMSMRELRPQVVADVNLMFVVTSLLGFSQLMPDSPFHTHPKTIIFAVACLLVYGLACDLEERLPPAYVNVALRGKTIFGTLLMASLAATLLPSFIQPVVYIVYAMFYGYELMQWLQRRIMDVIDEVDAHRLL